MKTKLTILLGALAVILLTAFSNTTTVYICTGKYAKKYHYKSNCRGLSNCKGEIKSVEYSTIKNSRSLCGWED